MARYRLTYPKFKFFHHIIMVSVLLVVTVAITITLTTIRMSERFFIENYTVQNVKVMNQIRRNIDSFHNSVVLTLNQIQQNTMIENMLLLENTPQELMSQLFTLTRNVDQIKSNMAAYPVSIAIVNQKQELIYTTDSTHWPISPENLREDWLMSQPIKSSRNIHYLWHKEVGQTIDGELVYQPYVIIKQPLVNRLARIQYGKVFIAIRNEDFADFFNSHVREGNHMFIVDPLGTVISSDQEFYIGEINDKFASIIQEFRDEPEFEGVVVENSQIIMLEYLPNLDVYIFNVMERQLVVEGVIDIAAIFLIASTIVGFAILVMFIATKRITSRLTELTSEISETSHSQFNQHLEVSGPFETREIAMAFNGMLDELHIYVEELVRTQIQKREIELTSLQRQINIHFLYNTLTSIKLLVQQGKKEDATQTIHDLISLLQFTVGDVNGMTCIRDEVNSLESYVRIKQKRYGDRIDVHFYMTPEVEGYKIPKLILQPFIENSFAHAFKKSNRGNIDVFVWSEDATLVCEISDNGDGFDVHALSQRKVETIEDQNTNKQTYFSGVGIQNVKERVHLLYGSEYGIEVTSKIGQGTIVIIRLPLEKL